MNDLSISRLSEIFEPFTYSPRMRIFLLYDENNSQIGKELTECFFKINQVFGEKIDFWTEFIIDENLVNTDAEAEEYIKQQGELNRFDSRNGNISMKPYEQMLLLARFFNCTVMPPTFLLWEPCTNTYMAIKKAPTLPLIIELRNLYNILTGLDFDWDKISEHFKEVYSVIDSTDPILKDIEQYAIITTKGYKIEELESAGFNADSVNELFSNRRQYNGYLDIKSLIINFKFLSKGNPVLQEKMQTYVDRYLNAVETDKRRKCLFPCIKPFVSPYSYRFIEQASGLLCEARQYNVDYSISAYCLGKAVEDELNLGVVQLIRKQLGIKMPENYNRFFNTTGDYHIKYYSNHGEENLNYNQKKTGNELRYPAISSSNYVLFHNDDTIDKRDVLKETYEYIMEKFPVGTYETLQNIISIRNDAVHKTEPISKAKFEEQKKSFERLINRGFFKQNAVIKDTVSH